jgi:hypothetical protein
MNRKNIHSLVTSLLTQIEFKSFLGIVEVSFGIWSCDFLHDKIRSSLFKNVMIALPSLSFTIHYILMIAYII